jgi:hypothetical protein
VTSAPGGGRPLRWPVEVAGLLLWLLLFTLLQAAAGKDAVAATANALALQSAERAVHLDIELSMNRWLAGHLILSHLAVYLYRLYYVVVAGVLVWVFVRHADWYRQARRALVAMTILVLPVYWAVPMSPPRFAQPGVTDIVGRTSVHHYTAMPSLHVGWALWCAYAVWSVLRVSRPRLAPLPWIFPLLMVADVLATGNHYVLDVVGSVVLVAAAVVTASMAGRRLAYRPAPPSPPR